MIDTLRLTAEEATRLVADKEITSAELYAAYRAQGTPEAFGIWQDGSIAAAPAGGMHMPEVLMRILLRGGPPAPERTRAGAPTSVADGNGKPALPEVVRFEPGRA